MIELIYKSSEDTLGQLVIRENGEIATDYIEAAEAARKREAMKYAGKQVLSSVGRAMTAVAVGTIVGLDKFVSSS